MRQMRWACCRDSDGNCSMEAPEDAVHLVLRRSGDTAADREKGTG